MRQLLAPPLPLARRGRRARGPFALCFAVSAALTALVAPQTSGTALAPGDPELAAVMPFAQSAESSRITSTTTDLMVLGRDAFRPIEAVSRLFPPAENGVHALIATAAAANDLPPDFFLRLLRQESGLNPYAVSPVGAQGIAQFMPGTAAERGLRNPFDPVEAIPKSAELLREHRARFGNLGLAAAAYNAGPQRVRGWLDGRSGLPAETRDYVVRITGRTIEDWAAAGGRTVPRPLLAFAGSSDLGFASTWPTDAFSRQASFSGMRQPPQGLTAPPARSAKRRLPRPSAQSRQARSEQALCALLNREGHTCLVQAVY